MFHCLDIQFPQDFVTELNRVSSQVPPNLPTTTTATTATTKWQQQQQQQQQQKKKK